jgi:hypothetical protein
MIIGEVVICVLLVVIIGLIVIPWRKQGEQYKATEVSHQGAKDEQELTTKEVPTASGSDRRVAMKKLHSDGGIDELDQSLPSPEKRQREIRGDI